MEKKFDSLYCTKKVSDYNADTLLISTCWGTILFSLKSKKEVARIFDERSTTNLLTQKEKSFYIGTPTTLYFKKGIADSCIQIALEKKLPTKISALCEDSQHRIWVGTDGWGIYLLNDKQKVIKKIDKQNLLESDNVHTITIDIFQRIWIGTDKGITLLEESKQGFKPYKPFADFDLKNYEINCLLVREDTVYFATSNEFIVGVYDNIPKYRNLSVLIKNVYVNNKEVQIKKNTFHPDENNIKLNLECPLIDSDEKALFQYALIKNNTDTIWQKSSNTSMELYSLSPGTYTMLIKAEDPSVSKSKSNTIVWHFTITEYFYKTWWFYTLVIFAIFSILFGVYFFYNKQKQNRIQKELEADAKINELKLQGLLSQMNPHFLFNSLNVIQKFITSNDDINALTHLSDFSDLMRESLDQTRRGHISLEDEFLFLEQYVNLEKKRFDNDFIFCIHNEIDDDLSDIIIPPMLIQPLVENAIKHGVANMKSPQGEIHVTFRLLHHSLLQVCIRDNGNQRSSSRTDRKKKESHALNIIQERVELIKHGDFSGKFDIKIDEIGATAILNIPIV